MIVIAAGGTGGHMVPGLAIAAALERARPGTPICFVGAGRELEASLAGAYPVFTTNVRTFSSGIRGRLAPFSVLPAVAQARGILRRASAQAVIGMGGYPSLPVVLAARTRGVPVILHEQNAVPGLANAVGARVTRNIAVSFAPALRAFGKRTPRLVGLPLRDEIVALGARDDRTDVRAEAVSHFGLDPRRTTVVVSGGSLGAQRLNDATLDLALRWSPRQDVQILLGCGRGNADDVLARAEGLTGLHVHPFIERMDLAYAAADVAVTRGGASTVAELAMTGTPSIIVPLPIARRKEQHANAAVLANVGGATVLENADVTGERLDDVLAPLLVDPSLRQAMRVAARTQARPDAADDMAAFVLEVLDAA